MRVSLHNCDLDDVVTSLFLHRSTHQTGYEPALSQSEQEHGRCVDKIVLAETSPPLDPPAEM